MAHNIDNTKGRPAIMTVGEMPWHKLGIVLEEAATAKEAIEHACLDYMVAKEPVKFNYNGEDRFIPGKFATYREDTGTPFGTVGKDYTIVQNHEAFEFFDHLVGDDEAIYTSAGALGKGERVFISAKMPAYIEMPQDDLIEQYVFITNQHDGRGSITCAITPIRIVCENTLNMALKNCTSKIFIRHTSNVKDRIRSAHKIMGMSNRLISELENVCNTFSKTPITDKAVRQLITDALRPTDLKPDEEFSHNFESMVSGMMDYYHTNETLDYPHARGTLYGVLNATTGYFQHKAKHKSNETRLDSIIAGTAKKKTDRVFKRMLTMV